MHILVSGKTNKLTNVVKKNQLYLILFLLKNKVQRQLGQNQSFIILKFADWLVVDMDFHNTQGFQVLFLIKMNYFILTYIFLLIGLISEWKPMVTLEGENTVLHMQVARFLLKQYERAMKGKNLGFST